MKTENKQNYEIAAYVWPSYTGDEPRARIFWNEGYGEWQSVRSAEAKYEGHPWPRRPLWGYVNEADPYVMEMEIGAAADHGVNVFAYDWYWYDHRPFLEQCLDNGFLKAKNRDRVKFYINWCNHDAGTFWDKRLSDDDETMVWSGRVTRSEFETIARRVIDTYFTQKNYYTVDGCPVFTIHFLQNFILGVGGNTEAQHALEDFRTETKRAGFPDLHLQLNLVSNSYDYSRTGVFWNADIHDALQRIRFDSASHYQFLAFTDMNRDYRDVMNDVLAEWEAELKILPCPYIPHVSIGWDNNPRAHRLLPIICKNRSAAIFEDYLKEAKRFIGEHSLRPMITVNSWNEWTEDSYLEPDDRYGYSYLEAVKRVFSE